MSTTLSSDNNEPPEDGEQRIYLVRYNYKGKSCVLELWATSFADAREQLKVLPFGTVMGELKEDVEIPKPMHPLVYLALKVRRWVFGLE